MVIAIFCHKFIQLFRIALLSHRLVNLVNHFNHISNANHVNQMFAILVVSLLSVAIVVRGNALNENIDKNVGHNAQKHLTITFYICHHSHHNNTIAWALEGTGLAMVAIIWYILDIVLTVMKAVCLNQALWVQVMRTVAVVVF